MDFECWVSSQISKSQSKLLKFKWRRNKFVLSGNRCSAAFQFSEGISICIYFIMKSVREFLVIHYTISGDFEDLWNKTYLLSIIIIPNSQYFPQLKSKINKNILFFFIFSSSLKKCFFSFYLCNFFSASYFSSFFLLHRSIQ